MRLCSLVFSLGLATAPCWAAEARISSLLRSMIDGGSMPTEKVFYETVDEDYVNQLSTDSVRDFLPLAGKLLQESRPEARKYGLQCLLVVTLRRSLDSEVLLEPYVPDLLRIADDRASPLRTMAIHVLSSTWPRLSPKTVSYLAAHLADKENTAEDTGWMACMLLKAGTDTLTHDAIAFVRKQDKPEVIQEVLRCFRILPIVKTADAIAFIGSGLDNQDVWVRRRAVEAVADLPLVERSPFLAQLSRLSTDSEEPAEIRSMAAEALKK
jgi:hypothetical protein